MPVFKNLQDVPALFVVEFSQPPVIDNQNGILGKTGQKLAIAAVTPGDIHFLEQSRQPEVVGAVTAAAGAVGQGAGNEGFAAAGGAGNDDILFSLHPTVLHQGEDDIFGKPPWRPEVDLLRAGAGVAKPGSPQQVGQPAVVPHSHFPVNEQCPAALRKESSGVDGALGLFGQGLGHAGELELIQFAEGHFQHHWTPPA